VGKTVESKPILNPLEEMDKQKDQIQQRMKKIRHKIAIISGKGGVGKSLVTINLAVGLARKNLKGKIAILDADLTGPCVPKMLGLKGKRLGVGPAGIEPSSGPQDVKVVSMDFLLASDDSPVIWRGPVKTGAIRQFLGEVSWGELDYLLVDLPPGTGDESLSILQLLPELDGVIIVTIPSEVSQAVVKKAVTFARKMDVPILGIIENMSGISCPHCGEIIEVFSKGGGEKVSREMDVELLGSIPLDPQISADSDEGVPFIVKHPNSPASKIFIQIIKKIQKKVE
jgi:ATP-binding protein involved in chromosome partitioning